MYHLIQYIQVEGGARAKEIVLYFIWHFLLATVIFGLLVKFDLARFKYYNS